MCRWECLPDLCHCAGRQHFPVVEVHVSPQPVRKLAAADVPVLPVEKNTRMNGAAHGLFIVKLYA